MLLIEISCEKSCKKDSSELEPLHKLNEQIFLSRVYLLQSPMKEISLDFIVSGLHPLFQKRNKRATAIDEHAHRRTRRSSANKTVIGESEHIQIQSRTFPPFPPPRSSKTVRHRLVFEVANIQCLQKYFLCFRAQDTSPAAFRAMTESSIRPHYRHLPPQFCNGMPYSQKQCVVVILGPHWKLTHIVCDKADSKNLGQMRTLTLRL